MDGTPVNGRSILLNQNETAQKVISIRQTDESILDYDSIEIWFMSQYQPNVIYDKVLLSVHFQPSSSPVTLTAENPVLNTDVTTGNGKLQAPSVRLQPPFPQSEGDRRAVPLRGQHPME